MNYMNLLMDADCLIKLTKAGLKELVANKNSIFIPAAVQKEVVESGKEKDCADAYVVEGNIDAGMISVVESDIQHAKGDDALIALFSKENYDAVATDDAKLTRLLRTKSISFILPGLVIYELFQRKLIRRKTALRALRQLAEFISEDEYSTVRLLMERKK